MSANVHKPGFVNRESISDRLTLFGTIVALMTERPDVFGRGEYYALQSLLYKTAKEVWPEGQEENE